MNMLNEGDYTSSGDSDASTTKAYSIDVGGLSFTKPGIYYYQVIEETGDIPGVAYDTTFGLFRIDVTDNNLDGDLEVAVTAVNDSTTVTGNQTEGFVVKKDFTNVYSTKVDSLTLNVDKAIDTADENVTAPALSGFLFELTESGNAEPHDIHYINTTGETADITITDTIPQYTTYIEGTASTGGVYDAAARTITWTFNDVAPWASVDATFDVTVDAVDQQVEIKNKANVNDGKNTVETNEVVNTTEELLKDVFAANDLTASIDGKTVGFGDKLTYTIEYANTTDKEVSVDITDTIPAHTTYAADSADNGGVYADGVVTWSGLKVAVGETVKVSFGVTVNTADTLEMIKNKATVVEGENKYTTNEVINNIVVKTVADAGAAQTNIDGKQVAAGDELIYSIKYTNTTGKDATVTITDQVPSFTTYVEDSASDGGEYDAETKTITWEKKVAAGESVAVSFNVIVDEAEVVVSNQAAVREGDNEYTTNEVTNDTVDVVVKDVFAANDLTTSIDG